MLQYEIPRTCAFVACTVAVRSTKFPRLARSSPALLQYACTKFPALLQYAVRNSQNLRVRRLHCCSTHVRNSQDLRVRRLHCCSTQYEILRTCAFVACTVAVRMYEISRTCAFVACTVAVRNTKFSGLARSSPAVRNSYCKRSLVPRLSRNANMYRVESLVSFVRKHDVIKIGQKQKSNVCALFNHQRSVCMLFNVR